MPERVADWLARAEIVLEVGGRYHLHFHGGDDAMTGVITRLEPPRLLELIWRENGGQESLLRWALEADGAGCRLTLTHTLPAGMRDAPGLVSGWHQHLDAIPAACDGVATPWDPAGWQALDDAYRASFPAQVSSRAAPA